MPSRLLRCPPRLVDIIVIWGYRILVFVHHICEALSNAKIDKLKEKSKYKIET